MLGLTRSTNCYPQRIRVLGLITDYEIGGILESTEIPLLDKLINSWEHVKQMELKMEGQFIGYRGYTVQMSKGVSSANCIHIEGINFMATKQLHCLYNHNEVEIGDVVRTSCGAGMMGVRTQECVRTITGAKLSEMVSYCRMRFQPVSEIGTFSAPRNHPNHTESSKTALFEPVERVRGEGAGGGDEGGARVLGGEGRERERVLRVHAEGK